MKINLKNSWVIIGIGNREYAINQTYITSISQINPHNLIKDSNIKYIKGTYNVLGRTLPILDGHSIACERTKYEVIKQYIESITNIKVNYIKFIGKVSDAIMDSKECIDFEKSREEFNHDINGIENIGDSYMVKLLAEVNKYGNLYIDYLGNVIEDRHNGDSMFKTLEKYETACKSIDKRIFGTIDKIIESANSKICEVCIIITVKNKQFGLSADSITGVVDDFELKSSKLSNVSSGSIYDKKTNTLYNIIDLTRLAKVIRD